ncbi:TKL family protein kinase [Tritrichomonas foetus]|uniref:TKL family protein kinase n=1 Tax=Tritrichomonas foetus TaxID=1144522 RepID=A0A1J4KTR5_9EUKA|nr:TKL family protein kinase [Tritrichomonas foetus]|eukprot:OHT14681.1 TKL family protein kinase [Tritrichomonas foetus]
MIPLVNMNSPKETLIQSFKHLEVLSSQTAVYRKIFEFSITQLRHFVQSLTGEYITLGDRGDVIICEILTDFQEFYHLLTQNLLPTWTGTTLENNISYVPDQIHTIFKSISQKVKKILPDSHLELLLDIESDQWNQYIALDLRAIEASFSQCLLVNKDNKIFVDLLTKKLIQIKERLSRHTVLHSSRIFSPIPVNYQSWKVRLSDFTILKEIGRGVTAHVYIAKDNRPGTDLADVDVAIKQFDFNKLNGARFQSFQREVAVLASIQHPALIKLVGATDTPPFCIITQWMPNGSLFHDLHRFHRLDATMKTIAAFDIARGMQFMHSRQIAHRDLKSLNVLLDRDLHAKVCDFGFSRHTDENMPMTSNIGTPHWMAPELLRHNRQYNAKVDVYAYGVVLWEIVTGKTPYSGMDAHTIIKNVLTQGMRPEIPEDVAPEFAALMTRCWEEDPYTRPTFDEIVRLFKANVLLLDGADSSAVAKYIEESATTGEVLCEEIEVRMAKVFSTKGSMSLVEAFRPLTSTTLPPQCVDICWETLKMAENTATPSEIANILLLFLGTSKHAQAAKILRNLPRNSVPVEVVSKFVEEIPTGSEEQDEDITVAACKNGVADLCAVYAMNPKHIALALDAVCQDPIDPSIREAIIDKCVASLRYDNETIVSAALRCLLVIGDVRRMNCEALRKILQLYKKLENNEINETNKKTKTEFTENDSKEPKSDSLQERANSLFTSISLVIITMSDQNTVFPKDIIDEILAKWPDGRVISTAIALSVNKENAEHILSFINSLDSVDTEIYPLILKIFIAAVRHECLKLTIQELSQKLKLTSIKADFEPAFHFLQSELGENI